MNNNGSVMNGLHKISGKIAEAARQPNPPPPPQTDNPWAESPVAPPTSPLPPRETTVPPPVPAPEAAPQEAPAPTVKQQTRSILGDALLKRYEDFLKTRRDLAARIVRETAMLRTRQEELDREAEKIRRSLAQLEEFEKTANSADESVDPGNQALFAAECRKIEHLRLELFRITEQTGQLTDGKKTDGKKADTLDLLSVLDSLTFSQMARAGFAFLFPLLVVIVLAGLFLAAAIILSFNGMFVW